LDPAPRLRRSHALPFIGRTSKERLDARESLAQFPKSAVDERTPARDVGGREDDIVGHSQYE
jgi:hypothetical protein